MTYFSFGPQLFGAIFGFVILKSLSKILPVWFGGGYFGEKENVVGRLIFVDSVIASERKLTNFFVVVQTSATAAGGLGLLFCSGSK